VGIGDYALIVVGATMALMALSWMLEELVESISKGISRGRTAGRLEAEREDREKKKWPLA
jgi:hypothetical protein